MPSSLCSLPFCPDWEESQPPQVIVHLPLWTQSVVLGKSGIDVSLEKL